MHLAGTECPSEWDLCSRQKETPSRSLKQKALLSWPSGQGLKLREGIWKRPWQVLKNKIDKTKAIYYIRNINVTTPASVPLTEAAGGLRV